eukprot:6185451-Pleurochrysis_carterae.AAC.1
MSTGFNAIAFAPLFSPHARTVLKMSDALATPYALARKKARSDALQRALRCLLNVPAYTHVASFAEGAHVSSECNAMADAQPRSDWGRFQGLCAQLHVAAARIARRARIQAASRC